MVAIWQPEFEQVVRRHVHNSRVISFGWFSSL